MVRTPVLSLFSSVRSRSDFAAASAWYFLTASGFVMAPLSSHSRTSACSGERTMYVAPKSVSQRVVNTLMMSPVVALKSTSAPVERPIQLRCCILTRSI